MLSLLTLLALAAGPAAKTPSDAPSPDVAVVCPREYRAALAPWLEHRQTQGHVVELLDPATPEALRTRIRALATGGKLTHVVLVGDADVSRNQGERRADVPTFKVKAQVNVKFG